MISKIQKNLLFVVSVTLWPVLYSHAQSVSTRNLDPSSLHDGIAMQVFSKLMVQMNQVDPKRYGSYAKYFLGFSDIEKGQLLEASSQTPILSEVRYDLVGVISNVFYEYS